MNTTPFGVTKLIATNPEILVPDRPISFNRDFVRLGIGIKGALFLSQGIYWSKRTKLNNGWFYKTIEEWEEETGLTEEEQRKIKNTLVREGFLEIQKKGVPAKNYFKFDLYSIAISLVESLKNPIKFSTVESTALVVGNQRYKSREINGTTTESTTESTPYISSAVAPQSSTLKEFWESQGYEQREIPIGDDEVRMCWFKVGQSRPATIAMEKEMERKFKRSQGQVSLAKPKSEIDQVFDIFKENPDHIRWFKNTTQRSAAEALLEKNNPDELKNIMLWYKHLKKTADKFFPEINSPDDLSKKFSKLMTLIEKAEKEENRSKALRL